MDKQETILTPHWYAGSTMYPYVFIETNEKQGIDESKSVTTSPILPYFLNNASMTSYFPFIVLAQLKELAYSPRNNKRTIPMQYTWTGLAQESVQLTAEGATVTHLRGGDSLLEIHLTGATFTPLGLRLMGQNTGDHQGVATFCTYGFLDFETLSTPLMSGCQPNYGFTSHYALSTFDLEKLRVQEGSITVELHQALGGVQFITRGRARITLMGTLQCRGERMKNRTNITGKKNDVMFALQLK